MSKRTDTKTDHPDEKTRNVKTGQNDFSSWIMDMIDGAVRELDGQDPERDLGTYIEEFHMDHDAEELAKACYSKGVTALSNNLRDSIRRMQE